jgi:hypothetical protein
MMQIYVTLALMATMSSNETHFSPLQAYDWLSFAALVTSHLSLSVRNTLFISYGCLIILKAAIVRSSISYLKPSYFRPLVYDDE